MDTMLKVKISYPAWQGDRPEEDRPDFITIKIN